MIRVLHVVFSLDAGGMENGIVNVSAGLDPSEFEIHVCCLARAGRFLTRFPQPERVQVLGKKEGFSPGTAAALGRHIRKLRPQVIHTHNLGPLIYASLADPSGGLRVLHGEHSELTPSELAPHRLLIRRSLYRRVRRIHTVSHSLRDSLVRQGFRAEKIEVIVNGVDAARFHPGSKADARRASGLPEGAILLGLVGRFGAFKRHTELIAAFEKLAPTHPSVHLVFAGGGGPLEQAVREKAAASPFAPRIHLAGFQTDTPAWYRALDLLVIPSINEGLSNALLESMACGVPALAHTACGNAEVIRDHGNGFLRDLSTPELLRHALESLLAAPENLAPLGDAARTTIENHFLLSSMVAGYEKAYRDIAAREIQAG